MDPIIFVCFVFLPIDFFDDIYMIEKDTCPCEPLISVGRIQAWGKMDETTLPIFPSLLPISGGRREKEKSAASSSLGTPVPEDVG